MRPCAPVSSRAKLKDWSPGRDKCRIFNYVPSVLNSRTQLFSPNSSYILACNNIKRSIKTDSKKKKRANPGSRKDIPLFWRLAPLIEIIVSTISQIRLIVGANTNRTNSVLNPASARLNPKSKSNLAPIRRRISN